MESGKDYIGIGCGAVILNEKNEILLLKRSKTARNKAGHWTIPGGEVAFGERVEDALLREVLEETGLQVEIIKLLSLTNDLIPEENQHWVSNQFLCKIKKGIPENKEPQKHDALHWWSLQELPELLTATTKKRIASLKKEDFS